MAPVTERQRRTIGADTAAGEGPCQARGRRQAGRGSGAQPARPRPKYRRTARASDTGGWEEEQCRLCFSSKCRGTARTASAPRQPTTTTFIGPGTPCAPRADCQVSTDWPPGRDLRYRYLLWPQTTVTRPERRRPSCRVRRVPGQCPRAMGLSTDRSLGLPPLLGGNSHSSPLLSLDMLGAGDRAWGHR